MERVIDPVEYGSENMREGRPVVRHLIDDVLPSRHGGLFCFVIQFSLDYALATREVARRPAGP
jgi:hypothetical protein